MIADILIVPDVHGEDFWRPALHFDGQVVFLGDYADPYNYCAEQGLSTFLEIVAFKRQNPDRVTLLLGNHELHYLDRSFRCARFSAQIYPIMHEILTTERTLFQVCKRIDNYLFTHGGVLEGWLRQNNLSADVTIIETVLNGYFKHNISAFNQVSALRGGHNAYSSPLWADIREHIAASNTPQTDYFALNLTQIIGHTRIDNPTYFEHRNIRLVDNRKLYLLSSEKLTIY